MTGVVVVVVTVGIVCMCKNNIMEKLLKTHCPAYALAIHTQV